MLVNKVCSIARAFPRCIYRSQNESITSVLYRIQSEIQPHFYFNFIKIFIQTGIMNYANYVSTWVSQLLCSVHVWRTDLKLSTTITTPPGCRVGTCFPRTFQNQVLWGYFRWSWALNWDNKCNWPPLLQNYAVSQYRSQLVIFTTCGDSTTTLIVEAMVVSGYCTQLIDRLPGVLGWIPSDSWLSSFHLTMSWFLAEARISITHIVMKSFSYS